MAGTPDTATSVAAEAADWYTRLRASDVSEIEAVRFRAWLAGDPERRREFDAVSAFWEDLAAIERSPEITRVRQNIAARFPPQSRWRGPLALVATILLAVGGAWAGWTYWNAARYMTNVGEQRVVPLADGSIVTLNTSTEIRLHYSKGTRRVELVRGQANFDVAKDPNRPFIVSAGGGEVRAVGTLFDVYRTGDKITVTLIEGKVTVTPHRPQGESAPPAARAAATNASPEIFLQAGEQVSFAAQGEVAKAPDVVKLASTDVPRVTAWRAHKLVFRDTPVIEAIAEANRYSREQIVLDVPGLANASISGTFALGKNEGFVEALQTYFQLDVERTGDDRIILTRRAD
ncbi:MAG: FecR family protein [Gammaproteobacteria bacterium]